MTDAMCTSENDLATKRTTRRTAAAFVASSIGAAFLVIVAWAIALSHLRVAVIDHTETTDAATPCLRALDFARIFSVLVPTIASGLIVSSTLEKSMETN